MESAVSLVRNALIEWVKDVLENNFINIGSESFDTYPIILSFKSAAFKFLTINEIPDGVSEKFPLVK